MPEYQRNWDLNEQLLTYAYNAQGHSTTYFTPFSLVFSRNFPDRMKLDATKTLQTNPKATTVLNALQAQLLLCVANIWKDADKHMKTMQRPYKEHHDRRISQFATAFVRQIVCIHQSSTYKNPLAQSEWQPNCTVKWGSLKLFHYNITFVSLRTAIIDLIGTQNTLSVYIARLAPSPTNT